MESCPVLREPPEGFPLPGAGVRPAAPEERPLRDALMDRHHHPGVRRIARVTRYREPLGKAARDAGTGGRDHTGTAYLITSPGADRAAPEGPLAPGRGHWAVENMNHRQRDRVHGGDACLTRTGNGPANRASPNSIAPAVVFASRRRKPEGPLRRERLLSLRELDDGPRDTRSRLDRRARLERPRRLFRIRK